MIGARIKSARRHRGWSQAMLSMESGVAQPIISRLESGTRDDVMLDVARRLARSLGTSIDFLADTWAHLEHPAGEPRGEEPAGGPREDRGERDAS